MKKIVLAVIFTLLNAVLGFAKPVTKSSISFDLKPLSLDFVIDYNMLFRTNNHPTVTKAIGDDGEVVEIKNKESEKFSNYLGFRAGIESGDMGGSRTWHFLDIGIIDTFMFNKNSGMLFTTYFRSNLDWLYISGDIKFLYNFNENFAMNIGLSSPVRYVKVYKGGNAELEDILHLIIGIYDILILGFNIYI